jgi:hypothetical protein
MLVLFNIFHVVFGTVNMGFIVRYSSMLQIGGRSQVPKFITRVICCLLVGFPK